MTLQEIQEQVGLPFYAQLNGDTSDPTNGMVYKFIRMANDYFYTADAIGVQHGFFKDHLANLIKEPT